MADISEEIIQYYNECQGEYKLAWYDENNLAMHYGFWDSNIKNHRESLINMNRFLANKLNIKPDDIILDAGCGIGGSSIWLAKTYCVKVTGINICEKQLKLAKNYAKKHKVDHLVKFELMDFTDTKFKNNSFNIVFAIESVIHADNKNDFIKEAYRILKPQGKLIIADGFKKKDLDKKEQEIINKVFNGWKVPNLLDLDTFKEYLEDAKFKNIKFYDIKLNITPSSKRIFNFSITGILIWKLLQLAGFKSKIQVNHLIGGINQYRCLKKGLWTYGVFYAKKH